MGNLIKAIRNTKVLNLRIRQKFVLNVTGNKFAKRIIGNSDSFFDLFLTMPSMTIQKDWFII